MLVLALLGMAMLVGTGAANAGECKAEAGRVAGPPAYRECTLQYYVQVLVGDVSLNQNLFPPLNTSYSGPFGHGELFAFNVTKGPERESELVGYARGFTIDSAYKASQVIDLIEVEFVSYNDGVYKGTIQIQAEIVITPDATNEVAIVGGTGSFRGARGFGFVSRLLLDGNYRLFRHQLHFIF